MREGTGAARHAQQRQCPIAVIDANEMSVERQPAAVSIHHRVPIPPLDQIDLLASTRLVRVAALGGRDALPVDHRRSQAGLLISALAIQSHQVIADLLDHAAIQFPVESLGDAEQHTRADRLEHPHDGERQQKDKR